MIPPIATAPLAALVVRRVEGRDAIEVAVAATDEGLLAGAGLGGGIMDLRPAAPVAAGALLAGALGLDALRDAAADAAPAAVAAARLEDALVLGGRRLAALAIDLDPAAPHAGRALAALRAGVSAEAHGADGRVAGAAWLDCGAGGAWRVEAGPAGEAVLVPTTAADVAGRVRALLGPLAAGARADRVAVAPAAPGQPVVGPA